MGAPRGGGLAAAADRVASGLGLGEDTDLRDDLERLRHARNLAAHEGPVARGCASAALRVATTLEGGLMGEVPREYAGTLKAWMVRPVVKAEAWWTVSEVRTVMIENAYSALPLWFRKDVGEEVTGVPIAGGAYHLLRDTDVAGYLIRGGGAREHLRDVVRKDGLRGVMEAGATPEVDLEVSSYPALVLDIDYRVKALVDREADQATREKWERDGVAFVGRPTPKWDPGEELIGVVTPHDLLAWR